MMLSPNKKMGDLIYVPSNTQLHQDGGVIRTESPSHMVIAKMHSPTSHGFYGVLHEGSVWYVNRGDTCEPKEG